MKGLPVIMYLAAALMTHVALVMAVAPSPSELCDQLALDSGTKGYLLVGPSGEDYDGTCIIEEWTPAGFDWEVYPIQDLEPEDYIEDTEIGSEVES